MVTKRDKHRPLYVPGSIMDRLSQLTTKQKREYEKLRADGATIKDAVDKVRPQIDQPCELCHWREEPDPRCRKCRGSGRVPLLATDQLVMVTNWEEDIIR